MEDLEKAKSAPFYWLNVEPKELWVRVYFDTTYKCEHIINNWSESFNNKLLDLRDLPLVKLVDKYTILVISLIYKRRLKCLDMDKDNLVPKEWRRIQS